MLSPEALAIEGLLNIADKTGRDVPFILNPAQQQLDSQLTGRDVIPKARQKGVSSLFLARNTIKCLGRRNTRAVVISHEREATERMLAKVHYFLKNIRGPKATIGVSAKNAITFPKTGSEFFIGTAGQRRFGRGDTITDLHCSEVAYWDDPKALTAGLFQAVPKGGNISVESTGNGVGNWYHRLCMRASKGESDFFCHFLPYHIDTEYCDPLTPQEEIDLLANLKEEWDEPTLLAAGLAPGFLAFRRRKLDELDYDLNLFRQEYPIDLSDCFQMAGSGIFGRILYVPTENWRRSHKDRFLHCLDDHPNTYYNYVIGADTAAGVGATNPEADSSAAEIWCLNTGEQVAEWVSSLSSPEQFAMKISELGRHYNNAFIVPELNNHGILTVSTLRKHYPRNLIYRNKRPKQSKADYEANKEHLTTYGFLTRGGQGAQSRFAAIGTLREVLRDEWVVHSPVLKAELSTFIEHPDTGKLEAETGCHDDTVMAAMCAAIGRGQAFKKLPSRLPREEQKSEVSKFSVDAILRELGNETNHGFSINDQVADEYLGNF